MCTQYYRKKDTCVVYLQYKYAVNTKKYEGFDIVISFDIGVSCTDSSHPINSLRPSGE